jgi:thioredoxin reductase
MTPRIAVLGAGPTGLEAALAAVERGWDVTVYEVAPTVAGHVRDWGHVRLFTPWEMDLSPRMRALLGDGPAGEQPPTGHELADVLERVAAHLGDRVRLSHRVDAVARQGLLKSDEIGTGQRTAQPFRILLTGPGGEERTATADVVLDCTGSWGNPAPLGDGGIAAPGERTLGRRVVRGIPDVAAEPARWAERDVLLVGGGNSAQTAARDLVAAGARLTWAVRAPQPTWGAVADDPLPDRVALVASSRALAADPGVRMRTGVVVDALHAVDDRVAVLLRDRDGGHEQVLVDEVVAATGFAPDASLYRQLQVHECYATEGPMALAAALMADSGADCLAQPALGVDALRNPEPRFFVLGIKSYGRNRSFLLRVGWEQVEQVVAALDAELGVLTYA